MSNFKDLKLYPNMPPVTAQFVFDSPKTFPSRQNPSELRYAYKLRLLEDHREYRAGDEVTLWTSREQDVRTLNAFKKGDRVVIQCPQEPGERFYKFVVRPIGFEEGPIYDTPPTGGKPNPEAAATPAGESSGEQPAGVVKMGEALAEAYEAALYGAEILRVRHGDEVADSFAAAMTTPDILQKTGVSLFIGKDRR